MSGRTVIGGVGYRWLRDASFGVVVTDRLAALPWPPSVTVMDLGYGAIYAAQDIADARPDRVVLVSAVERGDAPGTLRRFLYDRPLPGDEEILALVREAGAGVIDLEHLLVVGRQMRALPDDVVVIEVEPLDTTAGIDLTPLLEARLADVVEIIRAEAGSGLRSTSVSC